MKKKFDVIYADPPWTRNMRATVGEKYQLMKLEDIKNMPITDLCKENSACFLWVPNSIIPDGFEVLEAWGFTYRSIFFWAKAQIGLGNYFRNASETLLLGTRGKCPVEFHGQPNWAFMPRQYHSKKPEETYCILERMYPGRAFLELFARERPKTNGDWAAWGNECVGGSDIVIDGYPVPEYSDRVSAEDKEA